MVRLALCTEAMSAPTPSITIDLNGQLVIDAVFARATSNHDESACVMRQIILQRLITYYRNSHATPPPNAEETRIVGELTVVLVNVMNAQVTRIQRAFRIYERPCLSEIECLGCTAESGTADAPRMYQKHVAP